MIIEKDKTLNRWVVWLIKGSLLLEIFNSKTKRECVEFIERGLKNE